MERKNPLENHFSKMWKLCLAYAAIYCILGYKNVDGIGRGIFALISVAAILGIAAMLGKSEVERKPHMNPMAIFYFVMAVLLAFANCVTENWFFLFFNHVGSFLLFSIGCVKLFYQDKEWDFGKYFCMLIVFWVQTVGSLPMPFQDFMANRKGKKNAQRIKNPNVKYVLIGLLCGLPILVVATALLASADMIFSDVLNKIFNLNGVLEFINKFYENLFEYIFIMPIFFIIYFFLLYLVMGGLAKGALMQEEVHEPKRFQAIISIMIFGMVDVVYVLFSVIQFVYLFGGLPSSAHSYAEYAREGFFQLLFVALINFVLVNVCNKFSNKNVVLRISMTITCICTFVMIVSSAYRMRLYVHEYHLTFLRVLVLWFLLLLAFLMVGSTISIYLEKWNSFRYSLFLSVLFYVAFAYVNVDKHIARYNVNQYKDQVILSGNDGNKQLINYLPDGYEVSKCYAEVLDQFYVENKEILPENAKNTVENYFTDAYHLAFTFTQYDNNDNMVLDSDYYLYDSAHKAGILSWKHFNFVENEGFRYYKKWNP